MSHNESIEMNEYVTQRRALLAGLGGLAAGALVAGRAKAGPLDPPAGPITSTGKTLTEVEPRIAINQANTPGDAGSTFRITQPGSYYLTGNVTGESGKHGVEIAASGVSIDLMGFALLGVAGSLDGIATDGLRDRIAIRDGTVSGWGSDGINLITGGAGKGSIIESILASGNGTNGIYGSNYTIIRSCTSNSNGARGIDVTSGGVVVHCHARENGTVGISAGNQGIVEHCTAYDNNNAGISCGSESIVAYCISNLNNFHGIGVGSGSVVTGCTTNGNLNNGINVSGGSVVESCSSRTNAGAGILVGSGSVVSGCTVSSNASHGISVTDNCVVRHSHAQSNGLGGNGAGIHCSGIRSRIEDNNCSANDWGIQVAAAGNFIARNTCSSNSTLNWDVVANNKCLVVNGVNSAAISGDSGGVSPGSTNPNANYTF